MPDVMQNSTKRFKAKSRQLIAGGTARRLKLMQDGGTLARLEVVLRIQTDAREDLASSYCSRGLQTEGFT